MFGPIIRGEKITLEPPRLEDIDTYCAWFAEPEITRYLLVRFPFTRQQEEEWYERVARSDADVVWRIVREGRTIGNAGIHRIDWINRHASTGTVIGEQSQWGKGFASEAVRLRTAYAFEELGLERLETESLAPNIGMHRALKKSGYREIGRRSRHIYRHGQWHDSLLFELLREE